jgi:hypothetical protein
MLLKADKKAGHATFISLQVIKVAMFYNIWPFFEKKQSVMISRNLFCRWPREIADEKGSLATSISLHGLIVRGA